MADSRFTDIAATRYDLIVIGAGINGVAIARDAAMRGLRVIVVDKHDIASGTTSWSTRLIHGGLRYLEHAEFALVRESLRERERLLHNAPHLVDPLPLILPIYEGAKRGPALIRVGMGLYDALSFDKSLPRHKMLSRDETVRRLPGLNSTGLKAAARYYDAQVTFPERLAVELARSAQQHGARIETYAKVDRIVTEGAVVQGVELAGVHTGERATIRGRAVLNVSGPWVDELLGELPADRKPPRQMGGTKGSHLVVPGFPGAPSEALYVEAKSDGRAMFIVPWNNAYLIGTTDFRYDGDLDAVHADEDEVTYLLRETNLLFPRANLTVDDVAFTYSGVRPLPYTAGGSAGAITRQHQVKSHAPAVQGLWSVIGGKLTTHRQLAEEAVDKVCAALGIEATCPTRQMPLPGAAGIATGAFAKALQRDAPLPPATTARLLRIYGALSEEIVALSLQHPELAASIDDEQGAIAAEVVYGFEREGARTLKDLLMRRTVLGLNPGMAVGTDERAAAVAGQFLGWDADRQAAEVRAYREHIAPFLPHHAQ
jgi:glycerol-3-phosphate dehydrogenase